MFNVVDQFGMLWDVLGDSEEFYDAERTVRRVEYDRGDPIFLIFYLTSRHFSTQPKDNTTLSFIFFSF